MSRIEDALRKLEEGRRRSPSAGATAAPSTALPHPRPFLKVSLETANEINLDEPKLRHWGSVAMLNREARPRREYGQIKVHVMHQALGRGASTAPAANIVLVTSAVPGEGKSLTALNLAMSIALERDFATVLVDGDALKPDISRALNLDRARGLVDLIADESLQFADVLWRTSTRGLYFVPAGLQRSGATELFGSQRMSQLVNALVTDLPGTVVVFDSSPLLLTNESRLLASMAGQVLVVVKANQTPQHVLAEALEVLDSSKPIGLILNATAVEDTRYYGGVYGTAAVAFENASSNDREPPARG
jgi:Mrp family chromosome partitioning ATPase